jgi:hypothetical protein
MNERIAPPALVDRVRRDLAPVHPLRRPIVRALVVLPVGLVLMFGSPIYWGLRENLGALSAWASWGLSALEGFAGLLIVGAALTEAVPGRRLSARAVAFTIGAGVLVPLAITLTTYWMLPAAGPSSTPVRAAFECFDMIVVWAVPAVAVPAWLASRAWPERPAVAGAFYGLGTGVMADAGARLFCWISSPTHVIVSHGLALLAVTAAGAAAAALIDRGRAAMRSPR